MLRRLRPRLALPSPCPGPSWCAARAPGVAHFIFNARAVAFIFLDVRSALHCFRRPLAVHWFAEVPIARPFLSANPHSLHDKQAYYQLSFRRFHLRNSTRRQTQTLISSILSQWPLIAAGAPLSASSKFFLALMTFCKAKACSERSAHRQEGKRGHVALMRKGWTK